MSELGSKAKRLLQRALAGREAQAAPVPGRPFAGTGVEALALLEREAGARLVTGEALAGRDELAGAERGGLATALGLALGGVRAAVFLTGRELAEAATLLAEAVLRRAPLVVHVAGDALEAGRAGAEAGAVVLVPKTAAEAVDLAVAARRFAEDALAVALLALDGPALAFAVQEAWQPGAEALARRLGSPADEVHAVTPAQERLFGEHRRRAPRWHDSGRAQRLGGEPGPLAAAAASAARQVFFDGERLEPLAAALAGVAAATGRHLAPVTGRHLARVDLGIVACGPAIETAEALVEPLRAAGLKIGVLGVHRLAPFPALELAELARGCQRLAVIERLAAPAEGELARQVELALAAGESRALVTALHVPGDEATLSAPALAAACRTAAKGTRPRAIVGLARPDGDDHYPTRRALHDELARDYPLLAGLGAAPEAEIVAEAGGVTVAFVGVDAGFAGDAARLLFAAAGGHLRSRIGRAPVAAGLAAVDSLTWSATPVDDPGDAAPADVVIAPAGVSAPLPRLAPGATLLSPAAPPAGVAGLVLAGLDSAEPPALARERWLGGLAATLVRRGALELTARRLRTARAAELAALPEPEIEARLAALEAGFAGVAASDEAAAAAPPPSPVPPVALASRLARPAGDGELGEPAPFWHQTGLPIREGRGDRLWPHPALAVGALPAYSAPLGARGAALPRFDPALCTGCGACWSLCPHSAIGTRVQTPAALLEGAIASAGRAGASAEVLRRFVTKLAAEWGRGLQEAGGGQAGPLFGAAAERVLAGAGLDAERSAAARQALAAVRAHLDPLDLVATDVFYAEPEAQARGTGELLVLAVDPDRCAGCGLCGDVCEPLALAMAPRLPAAAEAGRRTAAALAALPDTAAATIARARADQRVGPLAGALLGAAAARPLGGPDAAPAGSGPRLAVRLALGSLAHHRKPLGAAVAARVEELRDGLAAEVHLQLARTLPDSDLAALAAGLDRIDAPAVALPALAEKLAGAVTTEAVDVPRLRRLVDAARAVGDLGARATAGQRAPLTVVVGPGPALAWARRFPDDPFGVPATVAADAPLGLAHGLALAETERAVAEARVLRRARLELDRPGEAVAGGEALAALAWRDLDATERALAAPVVALVDESLGGEELARGLELLACDLPVAIVTIATAPDRGRANPWTALGFAAPGGVVAHATVAHGEVVDEAAERFAAARGALLLRLLAPAAGTEPSAAAEILSRARGAVEAREFPLGCRTPAALTATAPRVDPLAETAAREREHAAALAALEAAHGEEIARLEADLRQRLAESARARMLELVARGRDAIARRGQEVS